MACALTGGARFDDDVALLADDSERVTLVFHLV